MRKRLVVMLASLVVMLCFGIDVLAKTEPQVFYSIMNTESLGVVIDDFLVWEDGCSPIDNIDTYAVSEVSNGRDWEHRDITGITGAAVVSGSKRLYFRTKIRNHGAMDTYNRLIFNVSVLNLDGSHDSNVRLSGDWGSSVYFLSGLIYGGDDVSLIRDMNCSTVERDEYLVDHPILPGQSIVVSGFVDVPFAFDLSCHYVSFELRVDAVQTHNAEEAIASAWGHNVDIVENQKLVLLEGVYPTARYFTDYDEIAFNVHFYQQYSDFVFKKTDSFDGRLVKGSQFGLYYDQECSDDMLIAESYEVLEGVCAFERFEVNHALCSFNSDAEPVLWLKELVYPFGGIVVDDALPVIVHDDGSCEIIGSIIGGDGIQCISNNVERTKLQVHKIDEDGNDLFGAKFELYKYGESGSYEYVCDLDVDETGSYYLSDDLDNGYYRLIESSAPVGYVRIQPVHFKLVRGQGIEGVMVGSNGVVENVDLDNIFYDVDTDTIQIDAINVKSTAPVVDKYVFGNRRTVIDSSLRRASDNKRYLTYQTKLYLSDIIFSYDGYSFVIHDNMSAGLHLDDESVYLRLFHSGEYDLLNCVVMPGPKDGCLFHVVVPDLLYNADRDNKILYLRGLNDDVIEWSFETSDDLTYLELSYDAYFLDDDSGVATSNESWVTCRTSIGSTASSVDSEHSVAKTCGLGFYVTKYTDDGDFLPGATFDLYRVGCAGLESDCEHKFGYYKVDTQMSDDRGRLRFDNMNAGYYKLVESSAPEGYELCDPVYLKIDVDYVDNEPIVTVSGLQLGGLSDLDGECHYHMLDGFDIQDISTYVPEDCDIVVDDVSLSMDIVDNEIEVTEPKMPETGGSGVGLLVMFGFSFVLLGSVYLLVVKQRA